MKRGKSANGEGDSPSFLITFDISSHAELRALDVARHLAKIHGRRKHVIVSLLNLVGDYIERTGKEFNPDEFAAAFMYGITNQGRGDYHEHEPIVASDESIDLVTTQTSAGVSNQTIVNSFLDDIELDI